ncbi:MAG: hypothetical protein ACP5HG_05155 [Anaerolineae bacterium]
MSTTQPEDLVLAVGIDSALPLAETMHAERRIAAFNRNPIALSWLALDLNPAPVHQVQAALTQLGDLLKGGRPVMVHINGRYATRCPHCRSPATAEWFAWDRATGKPFAKRVPCRECGVTREGPVDDEDLSRAGDYPPSPDPAFHMALGRVASPGDPIYGRVAELVHLYTQRNLGSLMDIINRLPQVQAPQDVRRGLTALVLDTLDRGTCLTPYHSPGERPRSLRPPQRFLEYNIWSLLEQALAAYRREYEDAEVPRVVRQAPAASLPALLTRSGASYHLSGRSLRNLDREELRETARALVLQVQPPDATFWALSILWATWLWGDSVPAALRGFLKRRRLDWEWYQRSLATAFRQLRPLLQEDATALTLIYDQPLPALRAVVESATQAGWHTDRWIACPPLGYRLLLRPTSDAERTARAGRPDREEGRDVPNPVIVATHILQQRGEPMHHDQIKAAAIMQHGGKLPTDFLAAALEESAEERPRLVDLPNGFVWLASPARAESPLADRVEEATLRLLLEQDRWRPEGLVGRIYALFNGVVSPEPELVAACIDAYTTQYADGSLQLRPEDLPRHRRGESQQIRGDVTELGRSLGYNVSRRLNGDIAWRQGGRVPYLFRVTTTAVLGPHLLSPPPSCDGKRCLIVPGGRAALTALKLRRDPRLAESVESHRWTFVKYRHLRRMLEKVTQRSDIEVYLGLDPIVEQETAQIPLPLDATTREP